MVFNMTKRKNELVFFLGAGVSVEAGVPDTRKFIYGEREKDGVQGFLEWLKENNKEKELEILETILNILKQKDSNSIIDVELVLGVLDALSNKEKYDLVHFFDMETFKFKSEEELQTLRILESDLKKYIRKKVVVSMDDISYLAPLIEFPKPIYIFSVNYDICIEMLCRKYDLRYTDGFELYWNPSLFEEDFDVKLFKLHGSIIWYLTDWGNYVKSLVDMKEMDKISFITGEIASHFIIYPGDRKWKYAEPLEYLSGELRNHLKNAEICIVIGYSFRDEDIRRIFFESSKENKDLTIVLISPNAGKIFKEKLRYSDEEKSIPSPISDIISNRVICFNYPIKSVLKDNYLYHCKYKIPQIRKFYADAENARREGNEEYKRTFKHVIDLAIEIGDVFTVERIFEKELDISPIDSEKDFDEKERFRLLYSLAIFYLLNNKDEKGKKYFVELRNILQNVLDAGKRFFVLNVELSEEKEKDGNEEKIKEIKSSIRALQKEYPYSTFYYWSARSSDLGTALKSFEAFIQIQLKLRASDGSISFLLRKLLDSCQNLLSIFNTQYDSGKYEDTKKVDVDGATVEIQRKIDLEKGLEYLINSIDKLIELYEPK